MKLTMDSAGRLVLPKEIRRLSGIQPGMELEVRVNGGHVEIEPAPLKIKLVRRGRLLVASPEEAVEPLTTGLVESTRRAIRRERGKTR
jgi:AbrB family looped-hinge helix DNA binding protein